MPHTRWYDKDENMKLLINMLEKFPFEAQESIAEEIIQLLMQKDIKADEFIKNLEYVPSRHRWYDKSESVHSAVKMLKKLTIAQRKEIFLEIYASVFDIIQQYKEKINLNNS